MVSSNNNPPQTPGLMDPTRFPGQPRPNIITIVCKAPPRLNNGKILEDFRVKRKKNLRSAKFPFPMIRNAGSCAFLWNGYS
jgi:hypothetical protein